jgi:hypothetical protein
MSGKEWREWWRSSERQHDLPANPDRFYEELGWISWADWLGESYVGRGRFRSFVEARAFVRELGLHSGESWWAWAKSDARPADIPASPWKAYQKQWRGWSDFLGTPWRRRRRGA